MAKLTALRDLHLEWTKITDQGLAELTPLGKLSVLYVENTAITRNGVAQCRKTMPDAYVSDGRHDHANSRSYDAGAGSASGALDDPEPAAEQQEESKAYIPPGEDSLGEDSSTEQPAVAEENDDSPTDDQAATDSAAIRSKTAIERLRGLGGIACPSFDEIEQEYIFYVILGESWQGTDADLALIDDIARLQPVNVEIDFRFVSPKTVSQLKLQHRLRSLRFVNETDQLFEKLKSLPTSRMLKFRESQLTPKGYRRVVALAPQAESLELVGTWPDGTQTGITDAGLAELVKLANLKELHIDDSPITQAGLMPIWNLKSLELLRLVDCPALGTLDFKAVGGLESIRTLDLAWVSAAGLANLSKLSTLEKLDCAIAELDPAEVAPLTSLIHLQETVNSALSPPADATADFAQQWADARKHRLRRVPLGNAISGTAGKLPDLRKFELHRMTIDDHGLEALVIAKKLQHLQLDLAKVSDRSLALAGRLPALQQLFLEGPGNVSDEGLAHLANLTEMMNLSLPDAAGVTDAGLAHLAGLTELKFLGLPHSKITGSGLAGFAPPTKLDVINLPGSSFDDAGCLLLSNFSQVYWLDLTDSKITDAGLESLARLSKLSTLKFAGAKAVTDAGLLHLTRLQHLQSVSVADTAVTRAGVNQFRRGSRSAPGGNVTQCRRRPAVHSDRQSVGACQ